MFFLGNVSMGNAAGGKWRTRYAKVEWQGMCVMSKKKMSINTTVHDTDSFCFGASIFSVSFLSKHW